MANFPQNSAFNQNPYIPDELPGTTTPTVGSTRRLGVVEVGIRDLEDMIHDLRMQSMLSKDVEINDLLDDCADRLSSYLPG